MVNNVKKSAYKAAFALIAALAPTFSAFAGMDNPLTGDLQGRYIGIVIAVMGAALGVIIIVALLSSKKRKK